MTFNVVSGLYTFFVQATDTAGNIGDPYMYQFSVDAEIPRAWIVGERPPLFTSKLDLQLELNRSEAGTYWCTIEVGDCIYNNTCFDDNPSKNSKIESRFYVCQSPIVMASQPALGTTGDSKYECIVPCLVIKINVHRTHW